MLKIIKHLFIIFFVIQLDFFITGQELRLNIFQNAAAETLKTEKIKDQNLIATLTMTTIGLLTSRLYSCKMTPDMMIAAAGGAGFIGGEIIATLKLNNIMKGLEEEIVRDLNGDINKEQVESFKRLRKSYEGAMKIANIKKMLQQAVSAAFLAAGVMAYTLIAKEEAAFLACELALMGPTVNACPGLAASATATTGMLLNLKEKRWLPAPSAQGAAVEKANLVAEKASEKTFQSQAMALSASYSATCATPGGAWACVPAAQCKVANQAIPAACVTITPTLSASSGFCPAPLSVSQRGSELNKVLMSPKFPILLLPYLLNELMAPNAEAALFTPLGITAAVAVSFIILTSKTLGTEIDTFLLAPKNRAIIWGVLGGLVYYASTATDNVIKKIESNIKKIDEVLNSLHKLNQGVAGSNATNVVEGTNSNLSNLRKELKNSLVPGENNYEDFSLPAGETFPCYTGSDGKNCKSFEDVSKSLKGFEYLDAETQKTVNGILKNMNSFNGGSKVAGATLKGIENSLGGANALNRKLANLKKDAQKRRLKDKVKFDPAASEKKFAEKLESSVRGALLRSNSSPEQMMASIYGSSKAFLDDKNKTQPLEDEKLPQSASEFAIGTMDTPGSFNNKSDLDELDESKIVSEDVVDKNGEKVNIDNYQLTNDITKDSSPSIFDLISNRYRASAFPRLFKVKE